MMKLALFVLAAKISVACGAGVRHGFLRVPEDNPPLPNGMDSTAIERSLLSEEDFRFAFRSLLDADLSIPFVPTPTASPVADNEIDSPTVVPTMSPTASATAAPSTSPTLIPNPSGGGIDGSPSPDLVGTQPPALPAPSPTPSPSVVATSPPTSSAAGFDSVIGENEPSAASRGQSSSQTAMVVILALAAVAVAAALVARRMHRKASHSNATDKSSLVESPDEASRNV